MGRVKYAAGKVFWYFLMSVVLASGLAASGTGVWLLFNGHGCGNLYAGGVIATLAGAFAAWIALINWNLHHYGDCRCPSCTSHRKDCP